MLRCDHHNLLPFALLKRLLLYMVIVKCTRPFRSPLTSRGPGCYPPSGDCHNVCMSAYTGPYLQTSMPARLHFGIGTSVLPDLHARTSTSRHTRLNTSTPLGLHVCIPTRFHTSMPPCPSPEHLSVIKPDNCRRHQRVVHVITYLGTRRDNMCVILIS